MGCTGHPVHVPVPPFTLGEAVLQLKPPSINYLHHPVVLVTEAPGCHSTCGVTGAQGCPSSVSHTHTLGPELI